MHVPLCVCAHFQVLSLFQRHTLLSEESENSQKRTRRGEICFIAYNKMHVPHSLTKSIFNENLPTIFHIVNCCCEWIFSQIVDWCYASTSNINNFLSNMPEINLQMQNFKALLFYFFNQFWNVNKVRNSTFYALCYSFWTETMLVRILFDRNSIGRVRFSIKFPRNITTALDT